MGVKRSCLISLLARRRRGRVLSKGSQLRIARVRVWGAGSHLELVSEVIRLLNLLVVTQRLATGRTVIPDFPEPE